MISTEFSPEYARSPDTCRRYGLSRSRLYLLAGEGLVRFVKVGSSTLVDLASVRDFLARCEAADIRASKRQQERAAVVARAHQAVAEMVANNPTVSGATLIMPWGERLYIDAGAACTTPKEPSTPQ